MLFPLRRESEGQQRGTLKWILSMTNLLPVFAVNPLLRRRSPSRPKIYHVADRLEQATLGSINPRFQRAQVESALQQRRFSVLRRPVGVATMSLGFRWGPFPFKGVQILSYHENFVKNFFHSRGNARKSEEQVQVRSIRLARYARNAVAMVCDRTRIDRYLIFDQLDSP